jgi:O-antigen/teichoic acid export membrane protein
MLGFPRLISSTLFLDVAKLVSGTAGGRLILLLALPVATRLYDTEDFQLLAVFVALVGTFSVIAGLRFEIAIPLAETDGDAANLLILALLSAGGISSVLLVLAGTIPSSLAQLLGVAAFAPYLWLVALGVILVASYSALQFWTTRMHRFGAIARTRIGQAGTGAAAMLCLGWAGIAPLGLMIGHLLSMGAGGLSLAAQMLRSDDRLLREIEWRNLGAAFRAYQRYPLFSTPEALANVAGIQMPILIIAASSGEEAGQLFLAMQVMGAPMTLLGASVGQVYASRAAEELRNGSLYSFTMFMMRRLFLIGLGPIVLAAFLAPFVFPLVFGNEWQRAGIIVAWIAPWMLAQLVVSPVSMGLHVTGALQTAMLLQFLGLFLRVGAVMLAVYVGIDEQVELYAVSGAAFYSLYALVLIRVLINSAHRVV